MPIYSGAQKIKTLQFGSQKIKEAWTVIGGVLTKVHSAFTASGMTKSGSFASANGSAWVDLTGWVAETGSTVTSNAVIARGSKTGATLSAQVSYTIPSGANTVGLRLMVNGVVVYTLADISIASGFTSRTFLYPLSTTYTIASGDAVKLQIKTQYSADTVNAGTDTYVRIT